MKFEHESKLLMVEDLITLWPPFLPGNSELKLRKSSCLVWMRRGLSSVLQFSQLLVLSLTLRPFIYHALAEVSVPFPSRPAQLFSHTK